MGKYILKRLVHSLITLCIVITIVLLLLRKMPIEGYFNNYEKMSQTQINVTLQKLGLKDPAPVQVASISASLQRETSALPTNTAADTRSRRSLRRRRRSP